MSKFLQFLIYVLGTMESFIGICPSRILVVGSGKKFSAIIKVYQNALLSATPATTPMDPASN